MAEMPVDEFSHAQSLRDESVQFGPLDQDKIGDDLHQMLVNIIGDVGGIHFATGEAIDGEDALIQVAMGANVTLIDEDDGGESRRAILSQQGHVVMHFSGFRT
jgi:hypothetical protein